MLVVQIFLGASLCCSWIYWLLCLDSARRWARRSRKQLSTPTSLADSQALDAPPPHNLNVSIVSSPDRPITQLPNYPETLLPPISILKPLCGADPEQVENFRSFCRQDYPRYQLIFGAMDPEDEGLKSARKIEAEFPGVDIEIVSGGEILGANRKVCNLAHMREKAKYEYLVLCDSDMRVEPDYLRRVIAPFEDESVGVVTCPYRGRLAKGFASSLEALGIGADFIPSVLLTDRFWGIRFAFGSTIAIRADVLEKIGGFPAFANELADDYLLGSRAAGAGYKVVLSDYVVDDVIGRESFREMWARRLRWARTTRAMHPGPVFASVVTFGIPLAIAIVLANGLHALGWAAFLITSLVRAATATCVARFYLKDPNLPAKLPLLPLSDLLSFALWALSFLGNSVEWRGEHYRVGRQGELTKID